MGCTGCMPSTCCFCFRIIKNATAPAATSATATTITAAITAVDGPLLPLALLSAGELGLAAMPLGEGEGVDGLGPGLAVVGSGGGGGGGGDALGPEAATGAAGAEGIGGAAGEVQSNGLNAWHRHGAEPNCVH